MTGAIDRQKRAEREASVAWAALVEYPDPAAAWLVGELGATEALDLVKRSRGLSVESVRDSVAASGVAAPGVDADALAEAFSRWHARLENIDAPEIVRRTDAVRARVIVPTDAEWPECFGSLGNDAPFAVWASGTARLDEAMARSVGVVGARSSTSYGAHVASSIAAGLADVGCAVVSGGAYGIDARAHSAALAAGGTTVAFLAGGVDRLYPAGNQDLLVRIREVGLLVSQVPPGSSPYRSRFLSRNRLIATAGATVVVEAAHRSGALNTARHAAGISRPVGAVPGPVTSAASAGCHQLIRDGLAVLVTSAQEVLELTGPLTLFTATSVSESIAAEATATAGFPTAHSRRAFDVLARPSSASAVALAAGLSIREALAALGALETSGLATCRAGLWDRGHT